MNPQLSVPTMGVADAHTAVPNIVAVGYRRINKMLHELVPAFASQAHVDVLDVGFEQAVAKIRQLQASQGVDVVVAAGANGAYLRQHLETPVVLVKVGGFDLMRALAQAKRLSSQIGLVTYEGMAPDLAPYADLFQVRVVQRSYQTEDEAKLGVQTLQEQGIGVVVGTGTVADQADALGLKGVFLYSMDAVRGALEDAVEVARASRIELAKRERLATILTQLSDGVIAVDVHERIETINPAMAQWLGVHPTQWQGRQLSDVCPELSLQQTLRQGTPDVEKIDQVKGKALIVNRMPIVEQGRLTGAVLTCQDPIRIQRVDRHIRSRIKPGALAARHQLDTFLGDSPAAVKLRQLAAQCARSSATVMLVGESGTGKELIAQGIHLASDRRDMPFVAVNCAAVTESLLESELFGYEDGAFTGARRGGKIGLFEAAHNGTIFLDEVGEMPLALQSRLLRVLQAREVLRVGATEPTPVNVRVIAATHRHLRTRVEQGLFRLDLLYRLDILRLEVPALRQRTQDISLIASTLHQRVCERLQLHPQPTEALLATLIHHASAYAWPGNVRELENVVERLVVFRTGHQTPHAENSQVLQALMPELFNAQALLEAPTAVQKDTQVSLKLSRLQQAQQDIQTTLLECGGDKALAASKLGISRTTLWRKLRQG